MNQSYFNKLSAFNNPFKCVLLVLARKQWGIVEHQSLSAWHLLMFSTPVVSLNNRHNRLLTDLIACELDSRVVLDLPQALVEAFPLVGLAKFFFILHVW